MRTFLACLAVAACLVAAPTAHADVKETVDLATVTFPDGWKRIAKERTYVYYETSDATAGTICRLYALVSATSTGALDSDFDAE